MPRFPINYANTIIYKIVCNDLSITECYVGHSTDFVRRKQSHKSSCKNEKDKNYNFKIYKTIRDNGGWTNWSMFEIEKFPCEDAFKACARERYHYEQLNSNLNMKFPQRNVKEYRDMNKEKINEYSKLYRVSNKEQIKEKRSKLSVCKCGREINHDHKSIHLKSKIHNDLMLCKNVTSVSV
jgi:hypothetical protein